VREFVVIELRWETEIRARADVVFSLLAELGDYDRWLPRSMAFHGTTHISEGPIGVGTTYIEAGPLGTRHGKVTKFERPTQLDFEQPMTLRPEVLGVIGIRLFHTLTQGSDSVHVLRVVQLSPRGSVKLVMPLVVRAFRAENDRMLRMLKEFAEKGAGDL
jgi:uncharacterized protein YndB with AHSA1/START domain